jgi:hypothetical protein
MHLEIRKPGRSLADCVKKKYMKDKPMSLQMKKQGQSQFWKGILDVKGLFYKNSKKIGNGNSTGFWNEVWIGDSPFSVRFKRLFELSLNKEITVNMALSDNCDSLIFRRRLHGESAQLLEDLKNICNAINLDDSRNKTIWTINKKGFSVKSIYLKCRSSLDKVPFWFIWKARIPQRIKVLLWLVIKNIILSKENLKTEIGKETLTATGVVVWKPHNTFS